MNTFLKKILGYPEFDPPAAVAAVSANPVVVNPSNRERIRHHEYRIHAIERYKAQKTADGKDIPAAKLDELNGELAVRRAKLAKLTKEGQ
jgi:hypothetical protein